MKIKEELRTFTDEAFRIATQMTAVADNVSLGLTTPAEGSKKLDAMARDLNAVGDTIKDLAYRLGRGEDRVTAVSL